MARIALVSVNETEAKWLVRHVDDQVFAFDVPVVILDLEFSYEL